MNEERTLYEVTGDIKDLNTMLIDRARMERALASESTSIPNGLSPESIARFIATRGVANNLQKRAPDAAAPHVPSPRWDARFTDRHEVAWTDKDGVHHSMGMEAAIALLERFWDEWPGGWSEVEAEKLVRSKKSAA